MTVLGAVFLLTHMTACTVHMQTCGQLAVWWQNYCWGSQYSRVIVA